MKPHSLLARNPSEGKKIKSRGFWNDIHLDWHNAVCIAVHYPYISFCSYFKISNRSRVFL